MNRIEQRFADLNAQGVSAFVPYITGGDPSLAQTKAVVLALEAAGADVIELGIPFSDPVGDGPTIQEATQRAIAAGTTPKKMLELVRDIRKESEVPLLLFTYYNPIIAYGTEAFVKEASAAGADGILCVDLPPEEADEYKSILDAEGMCSVFLTAPTTTNERLAIIGKQCTGFVYYISRLGVTGTRTDLVTDLKEAVDRIKTHTQKPVAVGFGISTPAHAAEVATLAEGVVVGSAIVKLIGDTGDVPDLAEQVRAFAKPMADATKATPPA